MSINKENMNSLNLTVVNQKENSHKIKNKDKKPYTKNHIKVKLNSKINPINKGLNIIDQNNNCIKMSKCEILSQEDINSNLNQNNINNTQKKIYLISLKLCFKIMKLIQLSGQKWLIGW